MIKKFAIFCTVLFLTNPVAFATDWVRVNLTNTEKFIYLDHDSISKNKNIVYYVVRYKNKANEERIAYVKYNTQTDKIGIMKIKDFEQDKYATPTNWNEAYAFMNKVNENSFFKNINNYVKDEQLVQKLVTTKQLRAQHETSSNTDLVNKYFEKNPEMKDYILSVQKKIHSNWVLPVTNHGGIAKVMFKIDREGNLISCEIKESSGNKNNDDSAINAVKNTAPFDKFPETANKDLKDVPIVMSFNYFVLDVKNK